MRVFKRLLLVAGAAVAAVSLGSAASAAVIIKPFLGGPFSALNPVGTLPATLLKKGNTYDFTFDLVPPVDGISATQVAAILNLGLQQTAENIQYQVYEGTPTLLNPESGTLLATSLSGLSPTVFLNLMPGDYYVNILSSDIAVGGEVVSGSFVTTPAPVPEPVTWAMMLLGAGMIGVGLRMVRPKEEMTLTEA
jgi:PEP-CTERM motif